MASLAFITNRRPTHADQEATLRQFAKTVVNLGSGLLLAGPSIPRTRNVKGVELFLSLGDAARERIELRHPGSSPRHYESVNRSPL
ncbi:hypothetical protein RB195_005392 [Necator americanus]|uniref:Uncharacterized protein n=1 Tax=Necator americanus TaxID=51031 RepID=A0ABR1BP61_NECAM